MTIPTLARLVAVCVLAIGVPERPSARSQQPDQKGPRPSQHGSVSQRINDTTITIEYNRPVARGREIFGKLVPYGRIWCPCADDATTVEVSKAVRIEGQELAAGKYSLWTEPQAEECQLGPAA